MGKVIDKELEKLRKRNEELMNRKPFSINFVKTSAYLNETKKRRK